MLNFYTIYRGLFFTGTMIYYHFPYLGNRFWFGCLIEGESKEDAT